MVASTKQLPVTGVLPKFQGPFYRAPLRLSTASVGGPFVFSRVEGLDGASFGDGYVIGSNRENDNPANEAIPTASINSPNLRLKRFRTPGHGCPQLQLGLDRSVSRKA